MFVGVFKSIMGALASPFHNPLSSVFSTSVFKYDPNQSRDRFGRWSEDDSGPAASLAKVKNIRDYSVDDVVEAALGNDPGTISAYRKALAEVNVLAKSGRETSVLHSKNGDGTGGYTDERKAYHDKILDYYFRNESACLPKEGTPPTVVILGGRGGSGKSNFNREDNKKFGVYSSKNSIVIDSDAIKEMLPEYVPEHAYLSHSESSYLADKITKEAKKRGLNVVLDITLRTQHNHILKGFKSAGYRTEAHFMHKDPKGALTGAVRRWNRITVITNPITKEAKIFDHGRLVPPDVIEGNVKNEKNFDRLAKEADHWSVVSNESQTGFQGRKVASKAKKIDSFSTVFKANPYHDENGKFTSKEKAAHRIDHSKGFASVLSSIGLNGKGAQTIIDLAKANHAKAKEHGVTDVALASSWLGEGHSHDTLEKVGIHLTDAEKKSFAHWASNQKGSAAKLKTFIDKTYPEVFSEFQTAIDTHGADSAIAKKAAKKNVEYIKQAYLYGATHEQVDSMQAIALEKHLTPKKVDPPALAKPAAPKFHAEPTVEKAISVNADLGKHYYMLRDSLGQNHPDVAAAYSEWQKSKDHLTEKFGYSKSQIGDLSSGAKNQADKEITQQKDALLKAKFNAMATLTQLAKDSGMYGTSISDDAINAAKAAGISQAEVDHALHTGKEQGIAETAKIKGMASSAVKSAASNVTKAVDLHGKASPEAEEALASFHSTVLAYSGHLSPSEITALKKEGKEHYASTKKMMAEATTKYGNALKVVDQYDKIGDQFSYLSGDPGFAKHATKQIAAMTDAEKSAIAAYTGSAFTSLNRSVGKAGTAIMLGKEHDTFTSADIERMAQMDSVFSKTTLGKNVLLRRNMAQKYFWEQLGFDVSKVDSLTEDDLKGIVGKVYKETAYSSTSMDPFFNGQFQGEASKTGGAVLHIRAGASMPGLRAKALSNHSGEEEVILPRGTTYVVRKITKLPKDPYNESSKRFEIYVDMIGAFPDAISHD